MRTLWCMITGLFLLSGCANIDSPAEIPFRTVTPSATAVLSATAAFPTSTITPSPDGSSSLTGLSTATQTPTFASIFLPTRPPLLADAVLNGNEVQEPILENYVSAPVYNVTEEMRPECWEDCYKQAWAFPYRKVIMQLNRGKNAAVSNYGLKTSYEAYEKFGASFQVVDPYDGPDDSRWSGHLLISTHNYEIVESVVFGEIQATLYIRENYHEQIPEGEKGNSDYQKFLVETAQRDARDLLNLQLNKLAWIGFEPRPSVVMPVVSSTPKPTPILPPRLPLDLTAFLNPTLDCQLPCWNGLTPGLSTEEEISPFFQKFGLDAESAIGARCIDLSNYPAGNASRTDPQICVFSNDGVVNRMQLLNWSHPEQFTPRRINIILGIPDKIFIPTAPMEDPERFGLILFYPEKGVSLEIQGKLDRELQGYLCISDRRFQWGTVTFFSDDQRFSLIQEYQSNPQAYVDWAQLRGQPVQQLYDALIDPNRCLPYPAYRK